MSEPTYSFRPTLFSAEKTISIEHGELVVEQKGHARRIKLGDITAVRLFVAPLGAGPDAYFCRVVPRRGKTLMLRSASYSGPGQFADRAAEYSAFVVSLIDKVAAANPEARFLAGQSAGAWWVYVILSILLVPIMLLSLVLAFSGGLNYGGLFSFLALLSYLPMVFRSVGRGRAHPLDIHHIDPTILLG
jgi:hypothetical protein